jgi:hypothetical protein
MIPDNLDPQIAQKLHTLKTNLPIFAKLFLKIVNDEGELVPLEFNATQHILHKTAEEQLARTGMVRLMVPKGRKQGVSTYVAARFFHKALFNPHKTVYVISHHSQTTSVLFSFIRKYYDNLPDQFKSKLLIDNTKELQFENFSRYIVATAGEGEIGRGTTPQYLHGSEVASFENPDAVQSGILQAVSLAPGTEIFLESTAKGVGNLFHSLCTKALERMGEYELCFLPWFVHERNNLPAPIGFQANAEEQELRRRYNLTNDQLYWRRIKSSAFDSPTVFMREFPATVEEAFRASGESFFDSELIFNARKSTLSPDESLPLVIGVDPARKGDRTVIVSRRGRYVYPIQVYTEMDEMRLASIVATLINQKNPKKVFIDTGLGYGTIDRLHELGFRSIVQAVNFGERASQPDVFKNKRSEMAHALKDWFNDGDVSIPDTDELEVDLMCIPESLNDSSGRLLIESKDNIKKKLRKSPDIFDALCLTFAYPVRSDLVGLSHLRYNRKQAKPNKYFGSGSKTMKNFDPRK